MSELKVGERIHHWQIVAIDGRRVTAQCRCHQIRIVAIDDLLSGIRTSCGCSPSPGHQRAEREARQEQERRRDRDWRPQR